MSGRLDRNLDRGAGRCNVRPESVTRTSWLIFVLLCSGVGTFGALGYSRWPKSPLAEGLRIDERVITEGLSPAEFLEKRDRALKSRIVRFQHEDRIFETTLGEVGISLDIEATYERASRVAHEGSWRKRFSEADKARRGLIDIPPVWAIQRDRAREYFEGIAKEIERMPKDARLDLPKRRKIEDVPGIALNVERAIDALEAARHVDEEQIELPLRYIPAALTLLDLVNVDIEKVVSAFETTFHTWGSGAGRAVNIRNAAAKIDGTVLLPGQMFSFNDTVGPRTRERGFTLAPEIQGDEMMPGIGGGTCQVSSTLYAAALFGALEIMDRQSHSKPSSYVKLGLDATVSFPLVDLKIKNSLSFPVMIHAYSPKPTSIRVEILGGDPVATVDYHYGVSKSEGFMRRIVVRPDYEPGRRVLHQKGSVGMDVNSLVRIRWNDGRVEERHYFSGYRPFPEIYWIAPGLGSEELPPLPEQAKGIEGQDVAAGEKGIWGPGRSFPM